ncbi:MAG: sodium:proton antiporter [Bacteroidetes bacterium HGW-Bacteroidetes-21]|jgi:ATP-binding protein involved in chromosome partitioning|nr:MAG: sodium:proton antiporter [Bacteroidetes bacterium HGW-Bacteroidetes-21]
MLKEKILEKLKTILHPEYKQDILSLGMLERYTESDTEIKILLRSKKVHDPVANTIRKLAEMAVSEIVRDSKKIEIEFVGKEKPAEVFENNLSQVKHIIAIASGKGGVGKSTVAANLAVSLATQGLKIGLLDADIYGPSIPKMFGLETYQPMMEKRGSKDYIVPAQKHGIILNSIGFFFDPSQALIWRGPMATSAIKNLLFDTLWGELDFLLIDMPPGTNDIHLTLVQSVGLSGAVVVTTPQMVAVADAIKGINMFTNKQIEVPVIGIVENMSWFSPPELPDKKYYVFGKGGGENLAKQMNVPLLGHIPVVEEICAGGDSGVPAVLHLNSAVSVEVQSMTKSFLIEFERISKIHQPKKVEIHNQ